MLATRAVLLVAGDRRVVTEWHTWDEVSAELGDVLGSAEERAQQVEQLRRELVLRRLAEQRFVPSRPCRSGMTGFDQRR
jgi:hypothetical protein